MSQIEDLKEQFKSRLISIGEKIQETEIYQKLSDRYQTLTPSGQKMVTVIAVFMALGLVTYYPLTQIQISKTFVEEFESKRNLIRDLFKVYRESSSTANLNPAPAADALISSVQSTLQANRLLPEQIISVSQANPEGKLIPKNLISEVVEVNLAKLNIRQVISIGSALTNISESVKVKDLVMQATDQMVGYFDVTYKLYALNVPPPPIEAPPEIDTKPKRKKSENTNSEGGE